jgi:hypothetical protein
MYDVERSTDATATDITKQVQPDLMREIREEAGALVSALPWSSRRTIRRRMQTLLADSQEQLARRKLQVAVEAEIATYVLNVDAARQVALVRNLHNHARMKAALVALLSTALTTTLEVEARHEENVDAVAGQWEQQVREQETRGLITKSEAARRLSRIRRRSRHASEVIENEADRIMSEFREQMRTLLAQAQRTF